jgi:L-fucose isomerase-like protein
MPLKFQVFLENSFIVQACNVYVSIWREKQKLILRPKAACITLTSRWRGQSVPEWITEARQEAIATFEKLGIDIVMDGWAYNRETAVEASYELGKSNCDALILNVLGWSGGDSVSVLAKNFPDTPLIVWTFATIRGSLCGFFEATSVLKASGKKFKAVLGETRQAKEQIIRYLKAAWIGKNLSNRRVAQIGTPPPGFEDATANEIDLKNKLGIEVIHLDVSELFSEIRKVSKKDAENFVSELKKKVGKVMVNDNELLKVGRIYVALQKIIGKYDFTGYALRCIPELADYSYPCLAVSKLAEDGVDGACEGDLPAAITMIILRELTSDIPCVFDVDSADFAKNSLIFWHCGQVAIPLAGGSDNVSISEVVRKSQKKAVLSSHLKPGKVTIAKLNRTAEKMFITSGEVIEPLELLTGAHAEVKFDFNVSDVIEEMVENGVEHHLCLVYGDLKEELKALCEILEITPVVANTQKEASLFG